MTVAVCQQPNYFSWIGYFEQCARADSLVILDSVQWMRRGLQNRAKILPHISGVKNQAQDFQWLSIPVLGRGHRTKTLAEMEIDTSEKWAVRHWKTLSAVYGKRPQFKQQFEPLLRPWFEKAGQYRLLAEATVSSMNICFDILDIRPEVFFSSALPESGLKSDRLVSLCQAVNVDTYYSGLASARYLDTAALRGAGIQIVWQRWKHTEYPQGRNQFRSHLSILDALAQVPISEIKSWIEIKPWGPFGSMTQELLSES